MQSTGLVGAHEQCPAESMTRFVYGNDVDKCLDEARPSWASGEDVEIETWFGVIPYLEFVMATAIRTDEVIEEMVCFMLKRRELKKPYTIRLNKMSRQVAQRYDMPLDTVKRRFRDIRRRSDEDCTY